MQLKTSNKTTNLLDGVLSIYDFSPSIEIPYQNDDSVEQSIAQHWTAVGNYLQDAMNDFDHEQKSQHG